MLIKRLWRGLVFVVIVWAIAIAYGWQEDDLWWFYVYVIVEEKFTADVVWKYMRDALEEADIEKYMRSKNV